MIGGQRSRDPVLTCDWSIQLYERVSYKYKELWKILEKRSKLGVYGGNKQAADTRALIIGAGPVGLR